MRRIDKDDLKLFASLCLLAGAVYCSDYYLKSQGYMKIDRNEQYEYRQEYFDSIRHKQDSILEKIINYDSIRK